jgi:drug/metabolite transporter (DMT)-like permease
MIRYLTAIIGALLIFAGVFFICGVFLNPHLPDLFQSYIHIGTFGTNNLAGIILGLLAAASSFFATLRRKK